MHAAAYRSADGKANCARLDRAVFGEQRPICEEDAGCEVANGAAIEQLPKLTIRIDGPTADNPRVEEVKTLFTRPVDLAVLLADQDRLALVDGDLRRADLDLNRHDVPISSRCGRARSTEDRSSKRGGSCGDRMPPLAVPWPQPPRYA